MEYITEQNEDQPQMMPQQQMMFQQPQTILQQQIPSSEKRKLFTSGEDVALIKIVKKVGTKDWFMVAGQMLGRTPRQCRDRYVNYLDPNINQQPFTTEEDALLIEKFKKFGTKWGKISKYFKRRSYIQLRNRFMLLSRKNKQPQTQNQSTLSQNLSGATEDFDIHDNNIFRPDSYSDFEFDSGGFFKL